MWTRGPLGKRNHAIAVRFITQNPEIELLRVEQFRIFRHPVLFLLHRLIVEAGAPEEVKWFQLAWFSLRASSDHRSSISSLEGGLDGLPLRASNEVF